MVVYHLGLFCSGGSLLGPVGSRSAFVRIPQLGVLQQPEYGPADCCDEVGPHGCSSCCARMHRGNNSQSIQEAAHAPAAFPQLLPPPLRACRSRLRAFATRALRVSQPLGMTSQPCGTPSSDAKGPWSPTTSTQKR